MASSPTVALPSTAAVASPSPGRGPALPGLSGTPVPRPSPRAVASPVGERFADWGPVLWRVYVESGDARDAVLGLPATDPLRAVTAGAALDDLERLEAELDALALPPAGAAAKRALAELLSLRAGYAARVVAGESLPATSAGDGPARDAFLAAFRAAATAAGVDPASFGPTA